MNRVVPARLARPLASLGGDLAAPTTWPFLVGALLAGAVAAWSAHWAVLALAAGVLVAAVAWRPVAVPLFLLVVCQEVSPGSGFSGLATLGSQLYYTGRVPPVLPLMALAVVVVFAGRGVRAGRLTAPGTVAAGTIAALIVLSVFAALYTGKSLFTAVNQDARPFLLLLLGFALGYGLRAAPGEPAASRAAVTGGLGVLVAAGALAVVSGWSADARVSRYFLFYDSALATVTAAILLALATYRWNRRWLPMFVAVAAAVITVTSFRRNAWVAAAAVLVVVVAVSPTRKLIVRRSLVGLAAGGLAVLVVPGLRSSLGARLLAAVTTVAGTGSEVSTENHLHDISAGWAYVRGDMWTGIGPEAGQLPGLSATNSTRVYVHNEWLLDWLRFGILGAVLITVLAVVLVVMGIRTVRRAPADPLARVCAMLVLLTPICLVTAPFLSTTGRWPPLVGIAVGYLAFAHRDDDRRFAQPPEV